MKKLSKEKKEKLIVEWEESGKSRAMFCREKGIKPTTFCGWVRKFKKRESGFVQIRQVNKVIQINTSIVVEKNNIKINIPSDMIDKHLKTIFEALS